MSTHLERMITDARERSAQEIDGAWDLDRSERVRAGALQRRDGRTRRDRMLRRGLVVAGGAGLLVLALLRGASSAPAEPSPMVSTGATAAPASTPTTTAASPVIGEAVASRSMSDAGYARD